MPSYIYGDHNHKPLTEWVRKKTWAVSYDIERNNPDLIVEIYKSNGLIRVSNNIKALFYYQPTTRMFRVSNGLNTNTGNRERDSSLWFKVSDRWHLGISAVIRQIRNGISPAIGEVPRLSDYLDHMDQLVLQELHDI